MWHKQNGVTICRWQPNHFYTLKIGCPNHWPGVLAVRGWVCKSRNIVLTTWHTVCYCCKWVPEKEGFERGNKGFAKLWNVSKSNDSMTWEKSISVLSWWCCTNIIKLDIDLKYGGLLRSLALDTSTSQQWPHNTLLGIKRSQFSTGCCLLQMWQHPHVPNNLMWNSQNTHQVRLYLRPAV